MSLSRSGTPSPTVQVGADSETELPPSSPSPPPVPVSEECYKSSHAVFIRCWNRGENSCSRCDFAYLQVLNSRQAYHRQSESVKSSECTARLTVDSSHKSYDGKQLDIKKEEKLSPVLKKRPPPESFGSDAQIVSSLTSSVKPLSSDPVALRAYMMMHDPTPALRQLSEYARPHLGGKPDIMLPAGPTVQGLPAPAAMPFSQFSHVDASYIQRQQARERLEELERRSHQVCKDDVKSVRDWPTASAVVGMPLSLPPTSAAATRDLPLAELQRLYGSSSFLPAVSGGLGAVPPLLYQAWHQSPDLAAEMLQRQRERLEQLAGAGAVHAVPGYHSTVDPIAVPAPDRLNIPTDPLLRLQLASSGLAGPGDSCLAPGVSAGEMSHTHTHSHTHLHLHQPDSASAAAASLFPPLHPLLASQLLQSSSLNSPADPLLAAGSPASASAVHRSLPVYPSVPGMPLAPVNPSSQTLPLMAAQQQEMLYRELLSRAPYVSDPVLMQQRPASEEAGSQFFQFLTRVTKSRKRL